MDRSVISGRKIAAVQAVALVALAVCLVNQVAAEARSLAQVTEGEPIAWVPSGAKFLVPEPPLILTYHNGPILAGVGKVPVYVIWYGNFSEPQKMMVRDFFSSTGDANCPAPSVNSWWKMTGGYKNLEGVSVPQAVTLEAEICDFGCSHGKTLSSADIETIVVNSLSTFPSDANALYMIFTSHDVVVADFCTSQCGSHYATPALNATGGKQLPYAWVGNPESQCAGKCAWPFAKPEYGPADTPLLPPNGDIGMDGMIINIAAIMAGTVTNPFNSGFYQGDGAAPLEAATACTGMFGAGAYSGYAGQLLHDEVTGDSYNAKGINNRKFLLPALWDPVSLNCTPPPSS
ncbi:protein MpEXL2 [Marchantia polymorpha subsp. ruderalis]|nr:hypothetical protein MARPO_0062s0015 [Marchantia polymorpha]BBN16292.1 hypothetical protein Mp_7g05100 [Marchantia polymorpha subsp. ruderalis]|eukprot:PTQ36589.1 hypothetical protein MARPO_0062s0015 [Marchantia polymorpha]